MLKLFGKKHEKGTYPAIMYKYLKNGVPTLLNIPS
jgi:hypothetical protein